MKHTQTNSGSLNLVGRRLNEGDEKRDVLSQHKQEVLGLHVFQRTWAEAYRHGDFYTCLHISAGREGKDYHLIFGVIPPVDMQLGSAGSDANPGGHNPGAARHPTHSKGDLMLVRARHSTECLQCIIASGIPIPSRVWLARPEDWEELLGDPSALRSLPSGQTVFKIVGVFSEGKWQRLFPFPLMTTVAVKTA